MLTDRNFTMFVFLNFYSMDFSTHPHNIFTFISLKKWIFHHQNLLNKRWRGDPFCQIFKMDFSTRIILCKFSYFSIPHFHHRSYLFYVKKRKIQTRWRDPSGVADHILSISVQPTRKNIYNSTITMDETFLPLIVSSSGSGVEFMGTFSANPSTTEKRTM